MQAVLSDIRTEVPYGSRAAAPNVDLNANHEGILRAEQVDHFTVRGRDFGASAHTISAFLLNQILAGGIVEFEPNL